MNKVYKIDVFCLKLLIFNYIYSLFPSCFSIQDKWNMYVLMRINPPSTPPSYPQRSKQAKKDEGISKAQNLNLPKSKQALLSNKTYLLSLLSEKFLRLPMIF